MKRKTICRRVFLAVSAFCAAAVAVFAGNDPTIPADALADRLRERIAESGNLKVWMLVVGTEEEGVALVGSSPETAQSVRKGSRLSENVDGIRVEARVQSVTVSGVALEPGKDGKQVTLPGQYSPLPAPTNAPPGFVRYLEAENVALGTLARMLADRTGVNISASDAAAKKNVSIFLRNVTVAAAVEEVCRTSGLWFRNDTGGAIIRIMTMDEYSENLASFREETMETFTLLYPNVTEVAGVIYGLYPDRTLLSLGEQEFDEDEENNLSQRFRRFRVLDENGGSQFMDMTAPVATGTGTRSGSGNFSFSRGNAVSRLSQWDQLRDRRRNGQKTAGRSTISQTEAKQIEGALQSGNMEAAEAANVQGKSAANIFVSISRKNNMLLVRTSDTKAMDEIRKLVKRLDVPTPMVLLEVKVLELAVDDNYTATFEYAFNRDTHSVGNNGSIFSDILQSGISAVEPTFSFRVVNDNIDAKIQLLQKDGKVKILATPTLLSANNEVSRIFSGKEYPLVTGWTAGEAVSSQSGIVTVPSTVEIERKDVGTMLLVTPNINADKTVTLRLVQENSEVSPNKVQIPVNGATTEAGSVRDVEYVESRSLTGTFVAKDGMMVMAGGLIKETESEVFHRTPVLGSIPLLGWLFRGTEKVKARSELIVLITPHVISTPYEGGTISEELLKVLSAHPARDGKASMGTLRDKPEGNVKDHKAEDDLRNLLK